MTQKEAAFIVGFLDEDGNTIAATTRLEKRENAIGLPGGKVEPGEDPLSAALREAQEEGWDFHGCEIVPEPIYTEVIEHYVVYWFVCVAGIPRKLDHYKEKYRGIIPIETARQNLVDYGNDRAIPKAWAVYLSYRPKEIAESALWNKNAIQRQWNSFGIMEDIDSATPKRFCQLLKESARHSSKRILKLIQRFDVAFITSFNKNLPSLLEEKDLRTDIEKLDSQAREKFANRLRKKEGPNFDRLSFEEQNELIHLERDREKRVRILAYNRARNKELEQKIRYAPAQYSYIPVWLAYHELTDGKPQLVEEELFIIIDQHNAGTLREDVIRWGVEYGQEAVVFKKVDKEAEFIYTGTTTDTKTAGDIRDKFQAILYHNPSVSLNEAKNRTHLKKKKNFFYFIQTDVPPKNKEVISPINENLKKKVFEKFYAKKKSLNDESHNKLKVLSEHQKSKIALSHIQKCLMKIQK